MITQQLRRLYCLLTGENPQDIIPLAPSGSSRRYYRLTGKTACIGVSGASVEENNAFIHIAAHLRKNGLPVPEVYNYSDDRLFYLQEDLGNTSLFDVIVEGREHGVWTEKEKGLLQSTVSLLPDIQFMGAKGMDFSVCYPQTAFNERTVYWDLNYFKYCFLKATAVEFNEDDLEDDFRTMSKILLSARADTFMYRDFQSRNVMIRDNQPWLIDFQGGRKGPVYYDVASFLWQAKANFPEHLREELLAAYIRSLGRYMSVDEDEFKKMLSHFVLFRTLQVLGAYGFRGFYEQKQHFLSSLPFAMQGIERLLDNGFPEYPCLCTILQKLTLLPRFANRGTNLTVKVVSFSYQKGIPTDTSGNGGGFVFDCRSLHNPGKYEQYKPFTGLNAPVIRFLEEKGEAAQFLEQACKMVEPAVQRFLNRGFTHLMVCFGCTGGQHRSVYLAQQMAQRLGRTPGVHVHLVHREQGVEQFFDARP